MKISGGAELLKAEMSHPAGLPYAHIALIFIAANQVVTSMSLRGLCQSLVLLDVPSSKRNKSTG